MAPKVDQVVAVGKKIGLGRREVENGPAYLASILTLEFWSTFRRFVSEKKQTKIDNYRFNLANLVQLCI